MKIKLIVLATLLTILNFPLFSASAGKITFAVGTVELYRSGRWQQVGKSQVLQPKDKIRAGKKATAILQLSSGATLKLKPGTELELSQVGKDTEIKVEDGAVFSKVIRKNEGETFKIRARTMVAAVRGTEFFFSYGERSKAKADLWLCVNEGLVNVTDAASKSEVDVKAGEGIFIPGGKAITPPKEYEWTKTLNWNMDPKQGDVKDTNSIKGAYKNLSKQNYD